MGVRSMVEEALNIAVDKYLDGEAIKKQLHDAVDKLVDEKLLDAKAYLKANVIDKIDGVDNIEDV